MISSQTVAWMRRYAERYLTQTALIEVQASTLDSFGGRTDAWETVAADVPCAIIRNVKISGDDIVQEGRRETMQSRYRLVVPHDTALSVDQRVTVDGEVYHVVAIEIRTTNSVTATAIITEAR